MKTLIAASLMTAGLAVLLVPTAMAAGGCDGVIVGTCRPDENYCRDDTGVFLGGKLLVGYSYYSGTCGGDNSFCFAVAGIGLVRYDTGNAPYLAVPCY